MRHILTIAFLFLTSLLLSSANDATLGWKTYLSYYNTTNVEESADQVFVVANGSLFTYGKEDNSIKQYLKGSELNDTDITHIRYNKQTKSLIIIYKNYNIDILEDGSVKNIPYLKNNTSLKNKDINSVTIYNEYAYLATNFGIMIVNMAKKEITDTYNLSQGITSCAIRDGYIYASTTNKDMKPTGIIYYASMNDNLLDKSNWKTYTLPGFSTENAISGIVLFKNTLFYLVQSKGVYYEKEGSMVSLISNNNITRLKDLNDKLACIASSQVYLFSDINNSDQINNLGIKDISSYQTDKFWIAEGDKGLRAIKKSGSNNFEALNEAIKLDGPFMNSPYKIVCTNDKVYVIPGGKTLTGGLRFGNQGAIMIYDYEKWSHIDRMAVVNKFNIWPRDYTSIVITKDASNDENIFVSSFGDGLIQFKNGESTNLYNRENSPISSAGGYGKGYYYVDGLAYDKEGNLWMTNSQVNNGVLVLDKENKWHQIYSSPLDSLYTINDILITSKQDKWINVPRVTPKIVVIGNSTSLDEAPSFEFTRFTDTDGNDFSPSNYTCLAEDKNGYIWIGTNKGPVYITKPSQATSETYASTRCTRVKLINEEDGIPFYFLDNVVVSCIKIDEGNRKWIGTEGSGIYVLDSDNQKVVHQFNTTNSPLLSDIIYSIEINNKTGEVFIGTDKGLVSYKGEATEGKKDYSDVYAYPNPVRPEQMDKVTITGLMEGSNVKITDLSGNIIYQTKSLGGQATWNCRNKSGVRVATGIYLVLAATEDSSESVVTKIAVIK